MRKLITLFIIGVVSVGAWGQATNKIGTTGNVGIGTTSTSHTLTVNGNFKVYNGGNYFTYNGAADLHLKYANRGSGGRAIVHYEGNRLWLNYAGDFSGGTNIGTNTFFSNSGSSYINTGKVGIGTTAPQGKLHVMGGNLDIGGTGSENYIRFRRVSDGQPRGLIGLYNSIDLRFSNHGGGGYISFYTNFEEQMHERLRISPNGNVGIGTNNPKEKLSVNGTILAKEVRVSTDQADWPDFVFSDTYNLKDLTEVENFIKTHKHLPDLPSAETMEAQGVNLAEMNKLLLQKVEELTLHTIAQEKKLKEMSTLKERLAKIEQLLNR